MELLACSGPGAGAAIEESIAIGYAHAVLVGCLLVVSLSLLAVVPRTWFVPVIIAGLLWIHPAWTISARRGDCGFMKRNASWAVSGIATLAILWQARGSSSNHRPAGLYSRSCDDDDDRGQPP
jgi:hypothetical protein